MKLHISRAVTAIMAVTAVALTGVGTANAASAAPATATIATTTAIATAAPTTLATAMTVANTVTPAATSIDYKWSGHGSPTIRNHVMTVPTGASTLIVVTCPTGVTTMVVYDDYIYPSEQYIQQTFAIGWYNSLDTAHTILSGPKLLDWNVPNTRCAIVIEVYHYVN